MQQSNVIFAMLLIAFLVFITVRGELATYIDLFRGGGQEGATGNLNLAGAASSIGNLFSGSGSAATSTSNSAQQASVAAAAQSAFAEGGSSSSLQNTGLPALAPLPTITQPSQISAPVNLIGSGGTINPDSGALDGDNY